LNGEYVWLLIAYFKLLKVCSTDITRTNPKIENTYQASVYLGWLLLYAIVKLVFNHCISELNAIFGEEF